MRQEITYRYGEAIVIHKYVCRSSIRGELDVELPSGSEWSVHLHRQHSRGWIWFCNDPLYHGFILDLVGLGTRRGLPPDVRVKIKN